jgi:branched-chain amino acid transport system substrate-binding protein
MQLSKHCSVVAVAALIGQLICTSVQAADNILIGRSLTLSGPLALYGESKRDGGDAYIAKVNAAGGLGGKRIELVTLDDAYMPANMVANLKKIAAENQPVAFLGLFGVPTTAAAIPVLKELKIPAVGLTNGTDLVRNPFNRYVFPVRASYADEARKLVSHAKTIGITVPSIVYMDNPFGVGVNTALIKSFAENNLKSKAYKVDAKGDNAAAISAQVAADQPQSVFIAALNAVAGPLMLELRKAGFKGTFYTFSPVDNQVMLKMMGAGVGGLGISQVFPVPRGTRLPVVAEYLDDIKKLGKGTPTYYGLEGYIEAKTLVEGLRRAGAKPTPESLIKGLETMKDYDAGGFYISYTPEAHKGSNFVEITVVNAQGEILR